MALSPFEQGRHEIGMLIMNQKDHNGNDINGFIVLFRIELNWIMDRTAATGMERNAEHGGLLKFWKSPNKPRTTMKFHLWDKEDNEVIIKVMNVY